MKKTLSVVALSLVATSFTATSYAASIFPKDCGYNMLEGQQFTFLKPSPMEDYKSNQNGEASPKNYDIRIKPSEEGEPIDMLFYENRKAKLIDPGYSIQFEPFSEPNRENRSRVRYYEAIADNCNTVFLRVDEDDNRFNTYFSEDSFSFNPSLKLNLIENQLGIRFDDSIEKAKGILGQAFYIPRSNGKDYFGQTVDGSTFTIKPYEDFHVEKIIPEDYTYNGKRVSSMTVLGISENGIQFQAPLLKQYLTDIKVTKRFDKFEEDIKQQRIRFGMDATDIVYSWGTPDKIDYIDVYTQLSGVKTIVAPEMVDTFAGKDIGKLSGRMMRWHYYNRLPENRYLIINEDAMLIEENQYHSGQRLQVKVPIAEPRF